MTVCCGNIKCRGSLASIALVNNDVTQLARTALLLLDYADEQGLERSRLLHAAGLKGDPADDPDARIRTAQMVRLWRSVSDALDDPVLGLNVARSIYVTELGLVGYAIFHSRTLHSALGRLARFVRIISEAVQFDVEETAKYAVVTWQAHPSLAVLRHPVEVGAALVVTIARQLTGTDLHPAKVDLPGSRPETEMEYRSFFGCPVEFDAPVARVFFWRDQVALKTRAADDTLVNYLDELATIKLHPLADKEQSVTDSVRRTLWSMLPGGRPDLWRTAEELGISVRTLQRRLGEEGNSFSQVLDDLRRGLSRELLADRRMSVSEVAFMLGYSEASAFQRAYRRWWGISARRSVA